MKIPLSPPLSKGDLGGLYTLSDNELWIPRKNGLVWSVFLEASLSALAGIQFVYIEMVSRGVINNG
jgi:hypothetical protein